MQIVAFGTSLMWGQGLQDADKIHSFLARKLQDKQPGQTIQVTFLAHSGASTGYLSDGTIDPTTRPLINREVPTTYPTILQEIESFDQAGVAPETVDLVLLDAGINDVHLKAIFNPLVTPDQIKAKVEIYCHEHMRMLVQTLLTKFTRARIVLLGYYEFLTEDSEKGAFRALLKAFGRVPGGFVIDGLLWASNALIRQRLLTNCDTFSDCSWQAFCQVADELNADAPKRVLPVRLPLQPENAAFASDPWLFGMTDDFEPEDPLRHERAQACRTARGRSEPVLCRMASLGHPNPKGAEAFADAILARL